MLECIEGELPEIMTLGHERLDRAENRADVACGDRVEDLDERVLAPRAQQRLGVVDRNRASEAGKLVEARQSVSGTALGVSGDQGEGVLIDLDVLELRDVREVLLQNLGRYPPEVEALRTRHDRR